MEGAVNWLFSSVGSSPTCSAEAGTRQRPLEMPSRVKSLLLNPLESLQKAFIGRDGEQRIVGQGQQRDGVERSSLLPSPPGVPGRQNGVEVDGGAAGGEGRSTVRQVAASVWVREFSAPAGKHFWFNCETREVRWTPPHAGPLSVPSRRDPPLSLWGQQEERSGGPGCTGSLVAVSDQGAGSEEAEERCSSVGVAATDDEDQNDRERLLLAECGGGVRVQCEPSHLREGEMGKGVGWGHRDVVSTCSNSWTSEQAGTNKSMSLHRTAVGGVEARGSSSLSVVSSTGRTMRSGSLVTHTTANGGNRPPRERSSSKGNGHVSTKAQMGSLERISFLCASMRGKYTPVENDQTDEQLAVLLRSHPELGSRFQFRRLSAGVYELNGKTLRLTWQEETRRLYVYDGPLLQPLTDYLTGTKGSETWAEPTPSSSALSYIPPHLRLSFPSVQTTTEDRLGAMRIAHKQAEQRERAARSTLAISTAISPGEGGRGSRSVLPPATATAAGQVGGGKWGHYQTTALTYAHPPLSAQLPVTGQPSSTAATPPAAAAAAAEVPSAYYSSACAPQVAYLPTGGLSTTPQALAYQQHYQHPNHWAPPTPIHCSTYQQPHPPNASRPLTTHPTTAAVPVSVSVNSGGTASAASPNTSNQQDGERGRAQPLLWSGTFAAALSPRKKQDKHSSTQPSTKPLTETASPKPANEMAAAGERSGSMKETDPGAARPISPSPHANACLHVSGGSGEKSLSEAAQGDKQKQQQQTAHGGKKSLRGEGVVASSFPAGCSHAYPPSPYSVPHNQSPSLPPFPAHTHATPRPHGALSTCPQTFVQGPAVPASAAVSVSANSARRHSTAVRASESLFLTPSSSHLRPLTSHQHPCSTPGVQIPAFPSQSPFSVPSPIATHTPDLANAPSSSSAVPPPQLLWHQHHNCM